jgi:hypothetical protein
VLRAIRDAGGGDAKRAGDRPDALAGGASRHHLLDVDLLSGWHRRWGG